MSLRQRLRKIFRRGTRSLNSNPAAHFAMSSSHYTTQSNKVCLPDLNRCSTNRVTDPTDTRVITPVFEKSIEGTILQIRSIGHAINSYYPRVPPPQPTLIQSCSSGTPSQGTNSGAKSIASRESSVGTVIHRPVFKQEQSFAGFHINGDTESISSDSTFFCQGLLAPNPRPAPISSDGGSTYSRDSDPESAFQEEYRVRAATNILQCKDEHGYSLIPAPTTPLTRSRPRQYISADQPSRLNELSDLLYTLPRGNIHAATTFVEILEQLYRPSINTPKAWHFGSHILTTTTLCDPELRVLHRAQILMCLERKRRDSIITEQDYELFKLQFSPDKGNIPIFSASAFEIFANKFYYDGVFTPAQRRDLSDLQPFYDEGSVLDPDLGVNDMSWLRIMDEREFRRLPDYVDVEDYREFNLRFQRPPPGRFGGNVHEEDKVHVVQTREDESATRDMDALRWDPKGEEESEWIKGYVLRLEKNEKNKKKVKETERCNR